MKAINLMIDHRGGSTFYAELRDQEDDGQILVSSGGIGRDQPRG
jgi:hypothetical protein